MALQDVVNVSISLQTSGLSRQGFGTPLFITAHNYFLDRVRSYTSLDEVAEDFPTDSNGYAAAASVFGNEPSVDVFKIGRQKAPSLITVTGDTDGVYAAGVTVAVTVKDANDVSVAATFTTTGGETVAAVATTLLTAIDAVLGAGGNGSVALTDNGDGTFDIAEALQDFTVSAFENSYAEGTALQDGVGETNNILNTYQAIVDYDNDFYVVAWEGRALGGASVDDVTFSTIGVLDLANTVEASGSPKLYFAGSSAAESITDNYTFGTTPSDPNDVLAYLREYNFFRTVGWWHQDADTTFNELEYAGYNLPFNAGSVVWENNQLAVPAAKNALGNALTSTEEGRLNARNASYADIAGTVVFTQGGLVAGGEWIDIMRGRDNLQADLEVDLFNFLTQQQGSKIPYTNAGINLIKNVVDTRLQRYKNERGFLTDPISITVPKAADIDSTTKASRVLQDMSFKATLAGAIVMVDLQGTLTY